MTSEEDFRAMVEANPLDFDTLLVFADWLQDRDDPRAEAWRALGVNRIAVWSFPLGDGKRHYTFANWSSCDDDRSAIPGDWWVCCKSLLKRRELYADSPKQFFSKPTAREAYDVVVAAFLNLPPERRAELCEWKAVLA